MVPVRTWVSNSVSWARLEEAGQIPLADLLETLEPRASSAGSGRLADPDGGAVDVINCQEGNPNHALGEGADGGCSEAIDGERSRRGDSASSFQGRGGGVHGGRRAVGVGDEGKGGGLRGGGTGGEPLYLHDWSLPQNLGHDSSLLVGRFQVSRRTMGIGE